MRCSAARAVKVLTVLSELSPQPGTPFGPDEAFKLSEVDVLRIGRRIDRGMSSTQKVYPLAKIVERAWKRSRRAASGTL